MVVLYTLVSVIIVSLVSLIGVVYLAVSKNSLENVLLLLVSLSAGTLLGGAFLHLIPEASEGGFSVTVSLLILAGVVTFFLLEKFVHMHRGATSHAGHHESPLVHESHKQHIGVLNLVGDGLHNFLDGLIIAGSYFVSVPAGIATTIAVIMHEVPQEIADFGVLLYAGYSKKKALLFNFLSAAVAIVGAGVGLLLGSKGELFVTFILPFAAGGFIYIAGSNLMPELHKKNTFKESLGHVIALLAGIGIMILLL